MLDYYKKPSYPQSSCPCEPCGENPTFTEHTDKNYRESANLPFNNCKMGTLLADCNPTPGIKIFRQDEQPKIGPERNKHEYTVLNKDFGLTNSKDFFHCSNKKFCNGRGYLSNDPRIRSPSTGELMPLDKPSYQGSVKLGEIYDDKYTNYGKGYKNYSDIHSGQIQYYVDNDIAPPYFDPLFVIRSDVSNEIFVDPMGSVKPQYGRNPLTVDNNNLSKDQFMKDSLSHREDIMAGQMAQINQRKWQSVWN
jgi:hypothetical protein